VKTACHLRDVSIEYLAFIPTTCTEPHRDGDGDRRWSSEFYSDICCE